MCSDFEWVALAFETWVLRSRETQVSKARATHLICFALLSLLDQQGNFISLEVPPAAGM